MAAPTLTQQEIDQLEAEKAKLEDQVTTLNNAVAAKEARAIELSVADGAFKKFFDYYNDDIIGQYDDEYRALNGRFIVSPITEADVVGPATLNATVRTTPSLPQTDIIRVTQFDGGGTSTDLVNESEHISDQASLEDALVNGYPSSGGFNPATAETASSLDSLSTTLDVIDNLNPLTIQIGDVIVVTSGGDFSVVEVTSVTDNSTLPPPYEFTYGIDILIPPSGTIPSGASLSEFTGFDNTERTNKTANNPSLQPLMDSLIASLEDLVNSRILRLNEQITALNNNLDPDAVTEIADTLVDINDSKTFLQNYLITTDISDTGLSSLANERATRSSQITTRVTQINNNYTNQTENYYDRRYQIANDRGNTSRGTLRLQLATEASVDTIGDYAQQAQDAVDAIDALLS